MTADSPTQHTPDPVAATPAPRTEEERQAGRVEAWSIGWMILALVVWGWFAFLLLADYGPDYGDRPLCPGPLVGPVSEDTRCEDDAMRQWPALMGVLALAVITTVTAAATTVYAKVLFRLARRGGPGVTPQD
ncbi:hypothetical protein C0216_00710 [Streptomyces globosus]|uniref:Uncharacterized protein n=1 Tax=Streptomyces globosus TaxID=68209 RepID=A0A344TU35_9ACTN|nr:hypothetical protein [Streptomyces globosus]AXE22156.1 hypothetical protein C0216_00710 [Streptomyces globosus]